MVYRSIQKSKIERCAILESEFLIGKQLDLVETETDFLKKEHICYVMSNSK
jgi:hypothetical protein